MPGGPPICTGTRSQPEMWCLVVPQLKQKQQLPIGKHAGWERSMRDFLANDRNCGMFSKLAKPSPLAVATDPSLPSNIGRQSSSRMEQLPTGLLNYILELGSRSATMSLGLCSRLLWNRVLIHVQDESRSTIGCWAGTPLICGATTMHDFPDTMTDYLPKLVEKNEEHSADSRLAVGTWTRLAMKTYRELERNDMRVNWRIALEEALSRETISTTLLHRLQSFLETATHIPNTTANSSWLLRNLSANEFVRLKFSHDMTSAPTEPDWGYWLQFPKCVYVEDEPLLSLDSALIMRIAWSGRDAGARPRGSPRKGIWAGYSFDVVPRTDFLVDSERWTDVTGEVVSDARSHGLLRAPRYGHRELPTRGTALMDPMMKMRAFMALPEGR